MSEFVVSVANVIIRNPADSDMVIGYAEANLDTSITGSMDSADVRGGKGNQKLFQYMHSKNVDVTLNSATFEFDYFAYQNGDDGFFTQASDVFAVECITLNAGSGTVKNTVVDNVVYVKKPNGSIVKVTSAGGTFSVSGLTTETVVAIYQYNTTVDKVVINANTTPKILHVVLIADIYDSTGKIGELHITIPRLQINGNFELSFTSDGVSTSPLEGTALGYSVDGCSSKVYGYLERVYTDATAPTLVAIAVEPDSVALGVGDTQALKVYAVYSNDKSILLSSADYTAVSSAPTKASVANGVVTGVLAGTAVVTVTYSGKTDTVDVTVS